jgi:hypothetical protein
MTALVLAAALLLQQRPLQQQSSDTTAQAVSRATISGVGLAVAEVRGALDLFRRAVFNDPDAVVVERAQLLRGKCDALATAARQAPARICRTCFHGAQPEIERYRTSLGSTVQTGVRCVGTVDGLVRQRNASAALKRGFRPLSQQLIAGMLPYENAIHALRLALGLEVPVQVQRSAPLVRRPR